MRETFDTPLRGKRLRRLRRAIRTRLDCLTVLPRRGRHLLELRAGLLGKTPLSRRAAGRRIGASPAGVLRLERSSLRRLLAASEGGRCGDGAGVATTTRGFDAGGPGGDASDLNGKAGESSSSPRSGLLADVHEGGSGIDLGDGDESAIEALLLLLLTLLALLGPVMLAALVVQRRAGVAGVADSARPLLFLDVDGVIALDFLSGALPPGRVRGTPFGLSYVPHRAGPLLRELAKRFDVVWATGWEHRANTDLGEPLGLTDDLPVVTFGGKARAGSSKWKIKRVDAYAGQRPLAWLDDHFVGRHERWAAHRSAPTLLVPIDGSAGLAPDHVERLMRWADRLEPGPASTPRTAGPRPARVERP